MTGLLQLPRESWSTSRARFALDPLLREIRLKVCREIVTTLAERDLWVDSVLFDQSIHRRYLRGEALRQHMLAPLLGEHDYWWLDASSVFGGRQLPLTARLPRMLSFGFDIGFGITAANGGSEEIGNLCALFNVAIAMFDSFCDRADDGPRRLEEYVHKATLRLLAADREALRQFRRQVYGVKDFELRCVLKFVWGFFAATHRISDPADPDSVAALIELIEEAYRAEMLCAHHQSSGVPFLDANLIRQKSVLPFQIMWRAAQLSRTVTPCPAAAVIGIGESFGLLDDLLDLAKDLRDGQVNGIVGDVVSSSGDLKCIPPADAIALALLDGEYIADSSERLCDTLQLALIELKNYRDLQLSLLIYMRSCVAKVTNPVRVGAG